MVYYKYFFLTITIFTMNEIFFRVLYYKNKNLILLKVDRFDKKDLKTAFSLPYIL